MKDQDRHKEKTRPKDKDKSRIKEHRNDDSFKDISNNAQRPPPLLGNVPGYLSTIDSSLSSGHPNVPSIVNQKEAKGPRKILINPHFKGGMGTSSGGLLFKEILPSFLNGDLI